MSDYRGFGLQRFYFTELRNVYYFCIILCVQSDLTGPHTSVLMKLWIKCAWELVSEGAVVVIIVYIRITADLFNENYCRR